MEILQLVEEQVKKLVVRDDVAASLSPTSTPSAQSGVHLGLEALVDFPWQKGQQKDKLPSHLFKWKVRNSAAGTTEERPFVYMGESVRESGKGGIQEFFTDAFDLLIYDEKDIFRFVDVHKTYWLGSLAPDIVIIPKNDDVSSLPHNTIVLGDVKGIHTSEGSEPRSYFTPSEKRQLLGYLKALPRYQPFRDTFYGFLTNGKIITFYSYCKSRGTCQESQCFPLVNEGSRHLKALLLCDEATLGFMNSDIQIEGLVYQLRSKLGQGATSDVWEVRKDGSTYALKVYKDKAEHADVFAHEVAVLSKFTESRRIVKLCQNIPTVTCPQWHNPKALLLQPVGISVLSQMSEFTSAHCQQMVDCLSEVHDQKLLVRPVLFP